jgi:hypothetical protein
MARDKIGRRFEKKQKKSLIGGLLKKNISQDVLDEEEELLANTKPVHPIQAQTEPGRNDPCPCGSGKKYKKCCALDSSNGKRDVSLKIGRDETSERFVNENNRVTSPKGSYNRVLGSSEGIAKRDKKSQKR